MEVYLFDEFDLIDFNIYNFFFNLSDDEIKNKLLKYPLQKDRNLNLMSQIFLKFLLQFKYRKMSYKIRYNKYQKPYLENENIYFNISHCDNFLVIAFSNDEIGIDIERINPEINLNICGMVLSNEEKKEFNQIKPLMGKIEYFYKIWTLKESYLKKVGLGLIDELDTLNFKFNGTEWEEYGNKNLKFSQLKLNNEYVLSTCADSSEVSFHRISLKEILMSWNNYE